MKNKSEIIIGCMSWGQWGKKMSTREQAELIHFCFENGNTSFDHADIYGNYTTESEFGKAFIESGINRDSVKLISKCGIQLVNKNRKNRIKHYNYSKDYIIWSAEESLRQLRTDYLDLFLLHRPSALMDSEEISEAIQTLKADGKILDFGISNFTPSQTELILSKIDVDVNQIEFSLTHNKAMQNGELDYMQIHNIRPLSWSPLGVVFKEDGAQIKRIKQVLSDLSKKYDAPHDTLLLSWILRHPSQISPVIGTTKKERIQNANTALELQLELEDWFTLLAASEGNDVP